MKLVIPYLLSCIPKRKGLVTKKDGLTKYGVELVSASIFSIQMIIQHPNKIINDVFPQLGV